MNPVGRSFAVAVGACLLHGAVAQTYSVSGLVDNPGGSLTTSNNPGTVSFPDGTTASGFANQTSLGASSLAVANTDQASMLASRTVTDWTTSGPTGASTNAAMNLSLTGTLATDTWYGTAYVQAIVDVVNSATSATVFDDGVTFALYGGGNGDWSTPSIYDVGIGGASGFSTFVDSTAGNASSFISALGTGLTFSTNSIAWTAGDVYDVTLSVQTYAIYTNPYGFTSPSDSADFSDPFSFGQPEVLDLPNGWSLNSPQSGILNNHLSTPEPSPFAALGAGLAGLLYRRRRGSRRALRALGMSA